MLQCLQQPAKDTITCISHLYTSNPKLASHSFGTASIVAPQLCFLKGTYLSAMKKNKD